MNLGRSIRDLSLRRQLMLLFALLAITTTTISTVALTSLSSHRLHVALRERSVQYARQMQQQLASVVAFNDHLSPRELFAALQVDHEIDGLAIYTERGELFDGSGRFPPLLQVTRGKAGASVSDPKSDARGHAITIAPIRPRDGPGGLLYVSLSTRMIEAAQWRDFWIACAIAAAVALFALWLAEASSRRNSARLASIAAAANRMASGDRVLASLDDQSRDEIGVLAHSFNTMVSQIQRVSTENERLVATERERLETVVAERTQALELSREMFRMIAESTKAIPFTMNHNYGSFPYIGNLEAVSAAARNIQWDQPGALDVLLPRADNPELRRQLDECTAGHFDFEAIMARLDERRSEMRFMGTCDVRDGVKYLRGLAQDITELRRLERELAAAQKLDSVGRLAAGVAHEINTPVQFVSDNIQFLNGAIADIGPVIEAYRELRQAVATGGDAAASAQRAVAAEATADLDYVLEYAPNALATAIEGLGRIAVIVRSMKEFAHPDSAQMVAADLNRAIQTTLVISRNEYKYVAEVDAQFGELPLVNCHLGEINQVVLNLIVNAAHAMADVVKGGTNLGRLTVRTRLDGNEVEIAIGDTGTGIPAEARDKIFEPFYTTKEVGKGTGQGLAIARNVIVNKHGGTLHFETECGKGTTFFIRLPIGAEAEATAEAVAACA